MRLTLAGRRLVTRALGVLVVCCATVACAVLGLAQDPAAPNLVEEIETLRDRLRELERRQSSEPTRLPGATPAAGNSPPIPARPTRLPQLAGPEVAIEGTQVGPALSRLPDLRNVAPGVPAIGSPSENSVRVDSPAAESTGTALHLLPPVTTSNDDERTANRNPEPRFNPGLESFEFPAPFQQQQMRDALDRATRAEEKADALEKRFLETEEQLKKLNESLGKIEEPKWFKDKIPDYVTKGFELHGYLRTGYGFNGAGGGQEEFIVPDGLFMINYRLGNEKDTYGEMVLQQNFNKDDPNAIQYRVNSLLAYKYLTDKTNYTTEENFDWLVRETYVHANNVLEADKKVAFWIGQRFYDRHDIYLIDHFTLDMSGWGGGVEDIDTGFGKLWVAYLAGTQDHWMNFTNRGTLTEHHLDLRLKGLEFLKGTAFLWFDLCYVPGGTFTDYQVLFPYASNVGDQGLSGNLSMRTYPTATFEPELGFATGMVHERKFDEERGFAKTFALFGTGSAADFNTYIVTGKPPGAVGGQQRTLVANWMVYQFNDYVSMMTVALFDQDNVGQGKDGTYGYGFKQPVRRLYSAGVRPVYMFSNHVGISADAGVDYVDEIRFTEKPSDGAVLTKIGIAPVLRKGPKFWDRPELRVFAMYAWWGQNAKGFVANPAYHESLSGWNFGVQAETWW